MIINKRVKVLVKLGQRSCLNKIKEAIALLPLYCVVPLTGMDIPVGSHASPKNKTTYGIINLIRPAKLWLSLTLQATVLKQVVLSAPYSVSDFFVV